MSTTSTIIPIVTGFARCCAMLKLSASWTNSWGDTNSFTSPTWTGGGAGEYQFPKYVPMDAAAVCSENAAALPAITAIYCSVIPVLLVCIAIYSPIWPDIKIARRCYIQRFRNATQINSTLSPNILIISHNSVSVRRLHHLNKRRTPCEVLSPRSFEDPNKIRVISLSPVLRLIYSCIHTYNLHIALQLIH